MKDNKKVKSFGEFNENLNISDVMNSFMFMGKNILDKNCKYYSLDSDEQCVIAYNKKDNWFILVDSSGDGTDATIELGNNNDGYTIWEDCFLRGNTDYDKDNIINKTQFLSIFKKILGL